MSGCINGEDAVFSFKFLGYFNKTESCTPQTVKAEYYRGSWVSPLCDMYLSVSVMYIITLYKVSPPLKLCEKQKEVYYSPPPPPPSPPSNPLSEVFENSLPPVP